jgi:hypothetical protein
MSVRIKRWLLTCTFAPSSAPRRYMTQSFFDVGTLPLWTFLFDLYTITKRTNRKCISCFVSLLFELVECKYLQFFLYILSAKNQVFRFFSCAFGDDGSYQRLFPRGAKSFPCATRQLIVIPIQRTCCLLVHGGIFLYIYYFFYKCKQLKIIGKVSLLFICF